MTSSINNVSFGFEAYNFMLTPPYIPTEKEYDDITAFKKIHHGYEPIVTMTSSVPQPVVPSQIDMHNIPESAAVFSPNTSTLPSCLSLTERIANVSRVPDFFFPEFHQYSKETYRSPCMKKRRRRHYNSCDPEKADAIMEEDTELRRQVHIQSEQKRRAQIKDGFDVLRQHLPGCAYKKMSKTALLHCTVQHVQQLKKNQAFIINEIQRLVQENETLKYAPFVTSTAVTQQQQTLFI